MAHRCGNFPGEDRYYTPEMGDAIDDILHEVAIDPTHKSMVHNSIAETLSHLATENAIATNQLLSYPVEGAEQSVQDILERLQNNNASVADKLRLLESDFCPDVYSLELARCHHFMENKSLEEGAMARLVTDGLRDVDIESLPHVPGLHKVKIQANYIDPEKEQVSGAIVAIKENISSTENGVSVRHRRKSYIDIAKIEELIVPREEYGGSLEDQKKQIRRQLRRPQGTCLSVDSSVAATVVQYIEKYPDHLLTSIYYGFRPEQEQGSVPQRPHFTGPAAVRSAMLG